VNSFLAVTALVAFVSFMLVLPLVPSLTELQRKTDALPLSVVQQNAGEIRHFANSFRTYIQGLEATLRQCADSGSTASGTLPDGTEYFAIGRADETPVFLLERNAPCHFVIAAAADLSVPAQVTFSNDIYTRGRFLGGEKNNYRAILCEGNLHLGPSSCVQRWVHAVGELNADAGCQLYGRASSDSVLRLRRDCVFLRLNAPRIEIGRVEDIGPAPSHSNLVASMDSLVPQRFLYPGDFAIEAGQTVRGNLVVRGRLRVGRGAQVYGSVKSGKEMILEDGVGVEGSLVSATTLRIGGGCSIHGPIIAERGMLIQAGTRCGSPDQATTVSAPHIEVEEGVVIFGTLWARDSGEVVAKA
jgi:cytoskeletal protein CcmA (bactofilin family)